MKRLSVLVLAAIACSGFVACARSDNSANAPSYDMVALSVDDTDAAAPSATSAGAGLTASPDGMGEDPCHPHLFSRTRQVVLNLNVLSYKLLSHVSDVLSRSKPLSIGETDTWKHDGKSGLQRQFMLTKTGADSYSFELQFAAAGSSDFVTVFSGALVHKGASAADAGVAVLQETTGTMRFDFSALASVAPEEKESGQIAYAFDRTVDPSKPGKGVKKAITVTFTNFMFSPSDPHGPRNGSYSYVGEPGNGGTLSYQDSLALLCPANPSSLDANTVTEARWYYDASDSLIHGRADAKATSGQIPAGDSYVGVACHTGPAPTQANENAYWMMKLEDAGGVTLSGSVHEQKSGSAPCDPVFGAVPSLTGSANDYSFGGALTFPNEW
jgi:hypothetical protein